MNKKGVCITISPLSLKINICHKRTIIFLSRFYDGAMAPLLSSLLSNAQLSDSDLKNMYHLIDSKLNGGDEPNVLDSLFIM